MLARMYIYTDGLCHPTDPYSSPFKALHALKRQKVNSQDEIACNYLHFSPPGVRSCPLYALLI
jgi:hypothetical protein